MVEDVLLVDVLDQDVEELGLAVDLGLELEVGRDGELDAQHRARDRLDVRRELQTGELLDGKRGW